MSSMFLNKAMRYYRFWIYSCNLALFLSVVIFVSLAAWTFSDYRMSFFPTIRLHHPTFIYAYLALILQGGILQTLGCLGALKLNERLLNIYWSLMLMLLVGDVIMGFVWIFHYNHIASHLLSDLRTRLQTEYGKSAEYQSIWDRIQREEHCCGVNDPQDFNLSLWTSGQRRDILRHYQVVPLSCCKNQSGVTDMENVFANNTWYVRIYTLNEVYQDGCYEVLFAWFRHSADMLSVLGFCVIAFLKVCFLGILRYEIREMIQKIKILKEVGDTSTIHDSHIHIPGSSYQNDTCCPNIRTGNHLTSNNNHVTSEMPSKDKATNGNNNDTENSLK
ncbi:tetraspanin-9-like [Tachypleus tridentatus]|uniref:tetraspanin-9-like n=1 Tax=Tachypleus tridentatus TaxID=6853 RepID=UPI003FD262BE